MMTMSSADDRFATGCVMTLTVLVGLAATGVYGLFVMWRNSQEPVCRTMIVETPRGESSWWAPYGVTPLTYDLEGQTLTADLPIGTLPTDGRVIITDARTVRCLPEPPAEAATPRADPLGIGGGGASIDDEVGFIPDEEPGWEQSTDGTQARRIARP